MRFLKIASLDVAESLVRKGYAYTVETLRGCTVYCFKYTQELAKELMSNYADEKFILDSRLCF